MDYIKNITQDEFWLKLAVAFGPPLVACLYTLVRTAMRGHFLHAGIEIEKRAILSGKKKITEFQDNNWPANASQVQNYSAITIAIVLLAVVFILEKDLGPWTEKFFRIIIIVVGVSSLLYTFSLQFWNCALDRAPAVEWLLRQRKIATFLQVVGWHGLIFSVILCVSLANTWCGLSLSCVGLIGFVGTIESKVPSGFMSRIQRAKEEKTE
jgi:hypothetical protein